MKISRLTQEPHSGVYRVYSGVYVIYSGVPYLYSGVLINDSPRTSPVRRVRDRGALIHRKVSLYSGSF